jgi:uncharacterized protein YqgC (DUF456 family)
VEWSQLVLAAVFAVVGFVCLLAVAVGLPGTWLLLGLAAGIELVDGFVVSGPAETVTFGWPVIGAGVALALVGEGIEAAAGALGAKWGGATRRGMVGAFIGGIVGAVLLTFLIPVPLLGTLAGALLGTFLGAVWGEWTAEQRRHPGESLRAAWAAVLGRLAGTLGKLGIGVVVWVVLVRAAFVA